MKRSVNDLVDFTICAKDGELGKVSEFYFDDHTWTIRYLVVKTGNWLSERMVLIPHLALGITDWNAKTFKVNLTMEQVRNSPDIDTEKTVSRQHEEELFEHYALPVYWGEGFYATPLGMVPLEPDISSKILKEDSKLGQLQHEDPHLRSTSKVKGYHIHANDGEIGHVEDFIVDDEKWILCFLIVATHNWLPGRKILMLPRLIKRIEWDESKIYVDLSMESIKNSPEFDSTQSLSRDSETELSNYYGKY
ncbi:MAG: PRC-barrel domain-containing protein [Ignavibacteriaceae bacterium]|nr:PRC-barrel domain-containing protein [Ignavibacteriaceae bacterium]